MLIQIISSSGVTTEYGIREEFVSEFFRLGDYQFVRPSILWNEGKTFFGADKGNESIRGFQNDIIMIQYDAALDLLTSEDVGTGATENDTFNHPACWVWLENNDLYCGQPEPHNEGTSRYKFNTENEINGGFVKLTNVENDYSYPKVFTNHNGDTSMNFRFDSIGEFDDVGIVISSTGMDGAFTATQITNSLTSGYRYYNSCPIVYGTSTKTYFTPTLRKDGSLNYFANAVLITTDFINYSNYQGTFSKDVVNNSRITDAEIEANCLINGDFSNDTEEVRVNNTATINDVLYGTFIKSGTTTWYMFKIDGVNYSEVNLSAQIPNLRTDAFLNNFIYFNGQNILLSVLTNDGVNNKEVWGIDLELTTFTQKYDWPDAAAFNNPIKFPENLDEVTGNYMFHVDDNFGTQIIKFELTNDKFFL